jgi:hypothetical protein
VHMQHTVHILRRTRQYLWSLNTISREQRQTCFARILSGIAKSVVTIAGQSQVLRVFVCVPLTIPQVSNAHVDQFKCDLLFNIKSLLHMTAYSISSLSQVSLQAQVYPTDEHHHHVFFCYIRQLIAIISVVTSPLDVLHRYGIVVVYTSACLIRTKEMFR